MMDWSEQMAFDAETVHFRALWLDVVPTFLERMELLITPKEGSGLLDIIMLLRPRKSDDQRRMMLTFKGVMNLRFNPGSNAIYFLQLEIEPIVDREYEGITDSVYDLLRYKVYELEQDSDVSFFCERFDVAVVSL